MARQATAEQRAKAKERRERFKALAQAVSAMAEDDRAQIVARCGAVVTVEGRPLSVHNSCLILHQLATASMVGGFQQWLKAGRCVRKGETGLSLWVPTTRADGSGEATAEPVADDVDQGGNEAPKSRARFIMGTVFDVTQTAECEVSA